MIYLFRIAKRAPHILDSSGFERYIHILEKYLIPFHVCGCVGKFVTKHAHALAGDYVIGAGVHLSESVLALSV